MSFISTVKAFGLAAKAFAVVNSPFLLVGAGIVGTGLAVYHAFKAGEKAEQIITAETKAKGAPLTFKEKWHVTWKLVIPVSLEFALAVASTITGTVILNRRLHSMTALADAAIAARNEAQHKLDQITEKHPELKEELTASTPNSKFWVHAKCGGTDKFHDKLSGLYWIGDYGQHNTAIADYKENYFKMGYSVIEELFQRFTIEDKNIPKMTALLCHSEDDEERDFYLEPIESRSIRAVPDVYFVATKVKDENGQVIPGEVIYELEYFPSGPSFEMDKDEFMRRLDLQNRTFEPAVDTFTEVDEIRRMKQCGVGI